MNEVEENWIKTQLDIGNINTFATLFESDFQDSEYFTLFLADEVS